MSFPLIPPPSDWENSPEVAADEARAVDLAKQVAGLSPAALATFCEELVTMSPKALEVLKFALY